MRSGGEVMKVAERRCDGCDQCMILPERELARLLTVGRRRNVDTRHVHTRTAAIVGVTTTVHDNGTIDNRKYRAGD
jgi:hypothetical protein